MSGRVHALVLLSRLCASPLLRTRTSSSRFASSGTNKTWTWTEPGPGPHGDRFGSGGRRLEDGGDEVEEVEEKIQKLLDEERKRQKSVKFHVMRRKMTSPGPPERRLSWDAMEQIRYLKQEQPEEWSVERLAQGFSVSPDVVRRVLRSKFVPSPERRQKQNAKANSAAGLLPPPSRRQDRLALPGKPTSSAAAAAGMLPSGGGEGGAALAVVGGDASGSLLPAVAAPPARRDEASAARAGEDGGVMDAAEEEGEVEEEERWDGRVLTEEEVEALMETEGGSEVMQVGTEFFDADGNFLYRI
ncbi:unnamed protein product [Ophioblennius macclurei]